MSTSDLDAAATTPARRSIPPRRLPVGADVVPGGMHFRVWAPRAGQVDVVLEQGPGEPDVVALEADDDGHFAGLAAGAAAGTLYRYRLNGALRALPDPASRFQPDGPHGPSRVVDPDVFAWSDAGWPGLTLPGQVFYELHVGTFTREGTWESAARALPPLAALGVTVVEVMPVAEFPGRFGWGYDGVCPFAPTRLYGEPDDVRRFVDRAHGLGLGVLLDVVYNHLGPDGCYLREFSPGWFSRRHRSEWGDGLNFDGPDAGPVRAFVVANAGYWIDEFHFDGLRLDATQSIHDASPEHVVAALTRRARRAAGARSIVVVAENEPQDVRLLRPPATGGHGVDALWNDDFHHAARVAVTGRREAYYGDYRGTARELVAAARHGFLYQGQRSTWQRKARGTSTRGVPPARLVSYLQNHDQVANSADGRRLHALTSPGRWRAITALLLLGPRPRCSSRVRSSPPRRPSCTSPTTSPGWPATSGAVARSSSASSGRWPRSRPDGCPIPAIPGPSSGASSIRASARRTSRRCRCTATCWPGAARIR